LSETTRDHRRPGGNLNLKDPSRKGSRNLNPMWGKEVRNVQSVGDEGKTPLRCY